MNTYQIWKEKGKVVNKHQDNDGAIYLGKDVYRVNKEQYRTTFSSTYKAGQEHCEKKNGII